MNPVWAKLTGTQVGKFILGLTGVTLKNNSGSLQVRNNGDTAFADASVKDITLENNSTTYGVTITTSGSQAADYSLTLPTTDGSPDQVLSTDGSGVLSWISVPTSQNWTAETTSFAFGSSSVVSMFTLPANALIDKVSVIVDTAFDGTPSMSVGVNGGSASKYVASGDLNLLVAARYDVPNTEVPVGTTEALEIAYTAGGATAGAGRVIVTYAVPI
jgi:hypothetical protein